MHLEVTKFQDQLQADTSIQRMEHCLQKMQLIYKQFKKRRLQPKSIWELGQRKFGLFSKMRLCRNTRKVWPGTATG
ncbi:hypothetical protein FKM82_018429 [Ascaphus truei]